MINPSPTATPAPGTPTASATPVAPAPARPTPTPAPRPPSLAKKASAASAAKRNADTQPGATALPDEIDLDDLAEPPTSAIQAQPAKKDEEDDEPTLAPEARAVIATCESELGTAPDPLRSARLHCEIARAYEVASGWSEQTAEHYGKALEFAPDYLPAIRGARRSEIERGNFDAALALFDAEEKLASSARRKALICYEKGRLIEDQVREPVRARELYMRGLQLDPTNASLLKAVEHCDRGAGSNEALIETFERAANAIVEDPQHRAALVVARARLIERTPTPLGPKAAELYEAALELDSNAVGALDALERIYRDEQDWRDLSVTLTKQAEQSQEPHRRAVVLYRLGHIQDERLSLRSESIEALVDAAEASPHDPLVLDELARGYELAEKFDKLADTLGALVDLAPDKRDRVALLHRLGQVLEGPLADPERAVQRYQQALSLEPTSVPVLQALGRLLATRKQWAALVDMHANEANATDNAERAANAHARIAEVFEVQLRDPGEAVNHHARALALVPGFATSFKALTRLYLQLDRHRELVELLERAISEAKLQSLKIAYLMKVGSVWEDSLGDPVQALHAYRRVQELAPEDLVAIHAIQRVTETAGRHKQLVEAIEREAELVGDRPLQVGLLHRAGTVLDDHVGDQEAALARFRKALELDPTFVPALASVGRIYYRAGRWVELLDVYERQAKASNATEAVALYYKMGELCEDKLGDNEAAMRWYRQALDLDKTYRPAIRALVRRSRESRDWAGLAGALEIEVASLEHAPARAVAWFRIGQVYEDWLGDVDKAMAAYRSALEQRASYRAARLALARLCTQKKQWMQLIDLLSQEVASTDDVNYATTILMRQGEIYRDELADLDLAVHCFEAALEHKVGVIPALLALEPLYIKSGAWEKLAVVYRELGNKLADPNARIAALRELARLQVVRDLGTADDHARTHEAILAIDRDDENALLALEAIGRESRDDSILIGVYRRLSEVTEHPGLAASFLTDLGQALERKGDKRALDAYRDAVKKDPSLLTAIRGLARVGDLLGNPRAMAQAARHEAELTRKPEIAARLYVRSGILRREQMNDLGAVEDFEKALEVWPDDTQAAERIIQPLLETGQVLHLIDVLSKAAMSAKSAERKTALWLEVGNLYAKRLDNLGASITAFKRALDATPGHVTALSRLADAYEKNGQWGDAVATLEQLLALTSEDAVRADAQLRLAAIFHEHLNKIDRATKCVEAVLRTNPKHAGALLRLADIQLRAGNEADAVVTTQKLVDLAIGPKEKGAALVRVARIQRTRGDDAAADTALSEALSLEGPGGDAERDLKKAIERTKNWVGYAAGLAAFIKRARIEPDNASQLVAAYLDLARMYGEQMQLPARAIDALTDGVKDTNGDQRVVLALARLLREVGRLDEALVELKQAVALDPLHVDSWRELSVLFDQGGRRDDAQRALAALSILGVDTRTRPPRPASAAENTLIGNVVASTLAADNCMSTPLANMVVSIADSIGKIYPCSLEQYGLTQRDRLGAKSAGSPWELAARIGKVFGIEVELYEHSGAEPMLVVEPFENPALIVSQMIRRLPLPQQVFLLAFGISSIATRLHPAIWLRTDELDLAVTGAVRVMHPNFTLGTPGDDANTAREALRKFVNRKWRRQMEISADELMKQPPADIVGWQVSVKQTMLRAAMLLADDLNASFEAMRYVTEMPAVRGAALVQGSEPVRDLMRFWISNRAASLRKHVGMVQG
ncbi:MAG TPA: tetratricopeptide repeat protein [Kofleriaceae bacterium]|nr:tetratricopeptide repeat protein [Kofleriaceae bacterium]